VKLNIGEPLDFSQYKSNKPEKEILGEYFIDSISLIPLFTGNTQHLSPNHFINLFLNNSAFAITYTFLFKLETNIGASQLDV